MSGNAVKLLVRFPLIFGITNMVSIKDVARLAGVSASTVSHVVNSTRKVAKATRENVEKAIAELGYQPSMLARALKLKRTQTIGMLVTNSTNPCFAEVVHGVEEGCYRNNFSLILCNSGDQIDRQMSYLTTLVQKQVDALVIMTINNDAVFYHELAKLNHLPKIILDSEPGLEAATIEDDSIFGGRLATEYLIKQGFKDIGCLTGPDNHPRSRDRFLGFSAAMEAANLKINNRWIVPGELSAQGGYIAMKAIIQSGSIPKAIFAFNDLMAMGAFRALAENGLSIPDDVSIIGYDDLELAAFLMPALTTVRQPSFELGLSAAERIINHLGTGTEIPSDLQLTPSLVVRDSVRH